MLDYFEFTGKTLLTVSDEITEAEPSMKDMDTKLYRKAQKPMQRSNTKALSTSMQKILVTSEPTY